MKTAVSLPDELFARAEAVAARLGMNRSQLYVRALETFIAAQGPDPVTESWNAIADQLDTAGFGAAGAARGRELVARGEWDW